MSDSSYFLTLKVQPLSNISSELIEDIINEWDLCQKFPQELLSQNPQDYYRAA